MTGPRLGYVPAAGGSGAHAVTHQAGGSDELILPGGHMLAGRAETLPRYAAGASITLASGTLLLGYVTAPVNLSATSIVVGSASAASATVTLGRVGVWSVDGSGNLTLLQGSVNDTALLGSVSTLYTKTIAAAALTRGSRYAVGVLIVGSTAGSVRGASGISGITSLAPVMAAAVTGQTDLPASVAVGSLTTAGNTPWFGLA